MKLHLDKCSAINTALLPVQGLTLAPYIETLRQVAEIGEYLVPESSINLPMDERLLAEVEWLGQTVLTDTLHTIFVVGIGGSNLGTKAIYDALGGDAAFERRLIFVDTNNSTLLQHCASVLSKIKSLDEVLILSISKSGGTSETLANTEILLDMLFPRFGQPTKDRLVVITDQDSEYFKNAESKKVKVMSMPNIIGGRFSVFSAVGLLPLYLIGVPLSELRKGAEDVRANSLNFDINQNPAALSALVAYMAYQHGQVVHDTFVFNSELESLGKWYRQLLGESIGKSISADVETARVGFVPTVSVGSTDLHSVGQLYLGGPARTVTTFVYSHTDRNTFLIPKDRLFPELASMISGKTTAEIMAAIRTGTLTAYNNQSLPFMEIELEAISPQEIGAFMQFKMIEMMYLGRLFGIDTFNQPAVELYKTETKRILQGE